ncbi:MAG: transporter substrate-binding domain-containing protein [bacterium]|jgi:polar amino acid transport system substrate-binding protein
MKRLLMVVTALLLLGTFALPALTGDTLDDVRKKGVLVVGVKDSTPPFGYRDNRSGDIIGYDVDIAMAVAKNMDVRLEIKPVTSSDRIPQLLDGNIDMIAATMSITPDRSKLIDFSSTYFRTTQKFLAKRGTIRSLKDLVGKKIATARGSTAERNLKVALPGAKVVLYDDYDKAARALYQGKVAALATDEVILAGLLAKAPGKAKYQIPDIGISEELYGLGVRKGSGNFLYQVNSALKDMGTSGEGRRIFVKWFPAGKVASSAAPSRGPTRKSSPKASAAASAKSYPAAGVVFRRTATAARFLVMSIKGSLVTGADVSVFDPQGHYICGGTVKSTYEDEAYVDVDKSDAVETGFVVAMNVAKGEAAALINQRRDIIAAVKAESKKESASMAEENKKAFEEEEKQRRGEQNAAEQRKFQQESQSDWYYYRRY